MDFKYQIIITKRAKQELREIYEYISKLLKEEKTAMDLINKIKKSLLQLEYIPNGFSIIDYYEKSNCSYRRLVINNYIVIYRVDKENKKVYVVRIIYGGKNYLNES